MLLCVVLLLCFGVTAQQQSEERNIPNITPNNNYNNPASYAEFDHYKIAKAKGSLVYGMDYIFEGISASDVSQQLIDEIDPYRYLNYFRDYEKVFIEIEGQNLVMILFPIKSVRLNELNEND
jgi:hypothetical protein